MTTHRRSPIVYAHRGASFELPENTLEAFALAIELGADAIETDCHMTRDGRIVLAHDPTGERTSGDTRAIRHLTFQELRAHWNLASKFEQRRPGKFQSDQRFQVPLLEDALAAFPDIVFNIDAKQVEPNIIPALVRAIRSQDAEQRVRIASFSSKNLTRARTLGYTGETGLSANEIARIMFLPRAALRWLRPSGHAAQVPRRAYGVAFDSQSSIDRLHELGLRVDFWTIDDPNEAQRLFAMGADGVMTDDPRTLCAAAATTTATQSS
jgi:glycerophosphoryl diester phosphodiesterase